MRRLGAGLLLLAMLVGGGAQAADEYRETRLRAGVRFFRALLAADLDITSKAGEDGKLLLLFAYSRNQREAARLAQMAARGGATAMIRELPIHVASVPSSALDSYRGAVPAGIFLAEAPPSEVLAAVVRYGIRQQRIVYSPFEGHVEKGVLGGLSVEARVRPRINMTTLRASKVAVKAIFLKVAKVHE